MGDSKRKAIVYEEHMKMEELFKDIKNMIEPVHKLVEEAASYVEPTVNAIIKMNNTEKREVDRTFNTLLNYVGMSLKAEELFKRLCNHYYFIDPIMVSEHIAFYLEMYGPENDQYSENYDEEGFRINSIDTIIESKKTMTHKPMTIITGDTHSDFRHVESMCVLAGTTKDDLLIILGDVGVNYYGGKKEMQFKHLLSKLPITMLCIHGNHERRPETLGTYQQVQWRGGEVFVEPDFPNLLFAKDGEIYEIDNKKCIVIGGAYSVDKEYRLSKNWGWWADEQPSEEIKRYVENRLDKENWCVDVVLTHTAPLKYEPREMFLDFIDDSKVDKTTEIWLDSIENRLQYNQWFCGHYHTNKVVDKVRFLYNNFYELK